MDKLDQRLEESGQSAREGRGVTRRDRQSTLACEQKVLVLGAAAAAGKTNGAKGKVLGEPQGTELVAAAPAAGASRSPPGMPMFSRTGHFQLERVGGVLHLG